MLRHSFSWFDSIISDLGTNGKRENQLDATQCFIEFVVCSTCFGHEYAHHQEPATIPWHVVYDSWLLVVGRSGAGQQTMRPGWGMLFDSVEQHPSPGLIACCPVPDLPTTSKRELYTTCHTNSIVAGCWWWAYSCPKHVEQTTSSIKHCVATSWFSSSHCTTKHGQTHIELGTNIQRYWQLWILTQFYLPYLVLKIFEPLLMGAVVLFFF